MNARIETIRARLAELEQEKLRLEQELESLSTTGASRDLLGVPASENPLTTPEERVALFMRLFRCRADVFPKMWESQKKEARGYSPACSAEWVRGVCGKPRVRCSECQNRAFIPFDESVIRNHIEGTLIAKRKLPALILVHRKRLADQWMDQLLEFTDLDKSQIGTFDHEQKRRKGLVDIGMLQTLARDNDPDRLIDDYDLIVVDECHHVPALSFEAVLKRIQAKYFLGLTATPYRKDGLERIITRQCGPVLHTMERPKPRRCFYARSSCAKHGFV